ncbi:cellulose binding domain-containing protein [Cellulomonas timonensis]|uniref:cellulose binding domain-containing protein n=1 Tax=Cellulomonas timonensis TaxID=1689271 RepID=UPI000835B7BF|nr:cellulose binding domain-containing protein [Cellulomonas timonensis]
MAPASSEWRAPLRQSIQNLLLGTADAPGAIRISSWAQGQLSEWRDWQTPTTPPAGACSATVTVSQWNGGFVAAVRVTAGAAAINRWNVGLTLPPGATITNSWSVTRSASSGPVQLTNVAYNGSQAAGQATEFGSRPLAPREPSSRPAPPAERPPRPAHRPRHLPSTADWGT